MMYNAKKDWLSMYSGNVEMSYPAEGVIRIIKGSFPELKMPKPTSGNILDVGCGDGRHFPLFEQSGLKGYGTEISNEICGIIKNRLKNMGVGYQDVVAGKTDQLPFTDNYFDYLLSWNSCYYMTAGDDIDFKKHVAEMARVLKPKSWIICSVPKINSFIFKNSKIMKDNGYRIIAEDPWGGRKGEIMRMFSSRYELVEAFSDYFEDFCHADIDMEWFGFAYHWHVFVAKKI
jgi:ubiquinone/menaquinone biosynthesis C-methylase UbiE